MDRDPADHVRLGHVSTIAHQCAPRPGGHRFMTMLDRAIVNVHTQGARQDARRPGTT